MKKLAIAASVLALASGTAFAADLAVKAPPYVAPAPVWSWAGFYIGGHGGYGWKDDSFSEAIFATNADGTLQTDPVTQLGSINGIKPKGWVAGGQFGYNWQYGAAVVGLEADLSATDIKANTGLIASRAGAPVIIEGEVPLVLPTTVTETVTRGDNVKLLGTARGRLGYAVSPDWLLYGTGGLAWENLEQSASHTRTRTLDINGNVLSSFTNAGSSTSTFFGWVAGVGVEARLFGSNWIGRLEYLHYDFGHTRNSVLNTGVGGDPAAVRASRSVGDQTIDVVRAGLSYKFN